jgi:hypothetical protein
MKRMIKHNQDGAVSGIGLSLIICVIILIATFCFAIWSFSSRQDYKNNTDQKIATAVTVAKQLEDTAKDKVFAEQEKSPLKTYNGPEAYGSIVLQYPKTWSGLVYDSSTSDALVNGYFYPGVVPSISDQTSTFALRMQVLSQPYSEVLKNLQGLQDDTEHPVTISPYALPKVPGTVGVQLNGNLPNEKNGVMVVLPLRNQTLQLWTEGSQFTNDFNTYILPNFSFSP